MKYPIKLGRSMDTTGGPVSGKPKKNEKFYPSLYLEWDDDYELPESGTMTVKFRKTSETNSKRPGDKSRQTVSLDILEITDTKAGKASSEDGPKEESGEEALDRLKKEADDKDDGDY